MSTVILIANQPSPMGLMYSLEALEELARDHPEKYYVEGDKLLLKETRPTMPAPDAVDSAASIGIISADNLSTSESES